MSRGAPFGKADYMEVLGEIRDWKGKPKELVVHLAERIGEDVGLLPQLIEILRSGSDVERGMCVDVMKHVSKSRPEIVAPYVDVLVDFVNYRAPRVKWGVQESIGNLAQSFPTKVEKAVPNLLQNTGDESTVVRWCAAFALAEILKSNPNVRREIGPRIEEIVNGERNNGVKNVYLKALRMVDKTMLGDCSA